MVKGEPASRGCSNSPLFFIGRNGRGNWVVQDEEAFLAFLSDLPQQDRALRLNQRPRKTETPADRLRAVLQ
jgi:hypothetical protein